jgi:hypothetical protein
MQNNYPIPSMYFIPLNYYHSFEYDYLLEMNVEQTDLIQSNTKIKLKRKLKIKLDISNIDSTNLECPICLESINLTPLDI